MRIERLFSGEWQPVTPLLRPHHVKDRWSALRALHAGVLRLVNQSGQVELHDGAGDAAQAQGQGVVYWRRRGRLEPVGVLRSASAREMKAWTKAYPRCQLMFTLGDSGGDVDALDAEYEAAGCSGLSLCLPAA